MAKVTWSLGREDSLHKEALRRLMQSIAGVPSPEERAPAQAGLDVGSVRINSDSELGETWALDQLWDRTGIRSVLRIQSWATINSSMWPLSSES